MHDAKAPQYRKGNWKKIFETEEAKQLYTLPLQARQFTNDYPVKREQIWSRILSKSYIAVLEQEERDKLHDLIESTLDQFDLPSEGDILYKHDKIGRAHV